MGVDSVLCALSTVTFHTNLPPYQMLSMFNQRPDVLLFLTRCENLNTHTRGRKVRMWDARDELKITSRFRRRETLEAEHQKSAAQMKHQRSVIENGMTHSLFPSLAFFSSINKEDTVHVSVSVAALGQKLSTSTESF